MSNHPIIHNNLHHGEELHLQTKSKDVILDRIIKHWTNNNGTLRHAIVKSVLAGDDVMDQWGPLVTYITGKVKSEGFNSLRGEIVQDEYRHLIFFVLIQNEAPDEVIDSFMELCDGHDRSVMESICCNDGNMGLDEVYLLHEACRYCTSPRLVKKIYSFYPDAIYEERGV